MGLEVTDFRDLADPSPDHLVPAEALCAARRRPPRRLPHQRIIHAFYTTGKGRTMETMSEVSGMRLEEQLSWLEVGEAQEFWP